MSEQDLHAVEQRRTLPVKFTQAMQLNIQKRLISRILKSNLQFKMPLFFKLFQMFPILRRLPARLMGVGIRPEHIRTPEA